MCIRYRLEHVDASGEHLLRYGKLTPVSYTHLDVYKRQIWGWRAGVATARNCVSACKP